MRREPQPIRLSSLKDIQPEVRDKLESALHKMIAKQANDLFQTMSKVVAALQGVQAAALTVSSSQQST